MTDDINTESRADTGTDVRSAGAYAFGDALRRFLYRPHIFGLVDAKWQCGWLDGGCLVLAVALQRWLGAESVSLHHICSHTCDRPHHFLARVNTWYLDGDGVSDEITLLRRWKQEELIPEPLLLPWDAACLGNDTPFDEAICHELVRALAAHFEAANVLAALSIQKKLTRRKKRRTDMDHFAFEETTEAHAERIMRPLRWTKIRRRALILKLEGKQPDEIVRRMGRTNCPWYLQAASASQLMEELAVEAGPHSCLVPLPGHRPDHAVARLLGAAQALGVDISASELSRDFAHGSSKHALAVAGVTLGTPPFGYKKLTLRDEACWFQDITVDGVPRSVPRVVVIPGQADVVSQVFTESLARSLAEVAAGLNAESALRPASGRPWTKDILRDMIRNPYYTGYILYKGVAARNAPSRRDQGTLYPGLHAAIVDWPLFAAAQDARLLRAGKPVPWRCPWEGAPV